MQIEGYMTTEQAAERLGVSSARIRQLIADGRLPASKAYPSDHAPWLLKVEDVEEFAKIPRKPGNPDWIAQALDDDDDTE